MKGDWQSHRKLSDRFFELPHDVDLPTSRSARWAGLFMRAYVEYETGNMAAGDALMNELVEIMGELMPNQTEQSNRIARPSANISRITGNDSWLGLAKSAAQAACSSPDSSPVGLRIARRALGLIAVLEADKPAAVKLYDILVKEFKFAGPMDHRRLLGLLAFTIGKLDQAAEHFEECLSFSRKAGYGSELAWTCCDYTDLLLERKAAGDMDRAKALLKEGLGTTKELGMVLLEKRLAERAQLLEKPSKASYPDNLTQREVEVLRLVVKGFTNQDIGDLLHISIKTAAAHITHILEKTGCANRAEASAFAIRNGLTED